MKKPEQASLFEFEAPQTEGEGALLRIRPVAAQLSAAQKKFNLLLEQIAAVRESVAMWTVETQRLRERHMLEVLAQAKPLKVLQTALALQLEVLLLSPPPGLKMTVKRRRGLTDYLLQLVYSLLEDDPDNPELHALHDRHSEDDFASLREEEREMQLEIAEDMLSDLYGDEMVDKDGVVDFEELIQRTHERAAQHKPAETPRKRNKREQASDARRKAETDALTQSLREIYRKLVSSLHPDRESDLEVRAQKTELMQRINIAYQNKDLLALLTLQMEVEQISAGSLGDVPEPRLAQYNQILREQLDTLKAQQQALLQMLFDVFDPPGNRRNVTAKDFDRVVDAQKKQIQAIQQHVEHMTAELKDPARRHRSVDEIVATVAEQEKMDRMQAREEARLSRYFGF